MNNLKKILIVGQTPPPFGGQAIMIEKILLGRYSEIKLFHVRMAFSKEMDEIGKLKISKFFHLTLIIFKIIFFKFKHGINILYFPPTGPNKIPFYRDFLILIAVRPFFKSLIFHFHAGGISELYPTLNQFLKLVFRIAYHNATIGIRLSENSPDDGVKLHVKNEYIIPYGITDNYIRMMNQRVQANVCRVLFVGLLSESKGLNVLINACIILKNKKINFLVNVMGKFESVEFEKMIKDKIIEHGLENRILFLGVCSGENKFGMYLNSDIFCFPSFFEAESFPVVLLEASSFSLPIVSSQWRGIPSIVEDNVSGYLVPIKDHMAVAEKLQLLMENAELRIALGANARQRYLKNWTESQFYASIESALSSS